MHSSPSQIPCSYLTFRLGGELFAIKVSLVREILEMPRITPVPSSPPYMRGVVNVRGSATAVMDLRTRFGLPITKDTLNTRIIVMQFQLDDEEVVLGGLADSVHEVVDLFPSQIAPPPKAGMRWRSEIIEGICKRDTGFVILLDLTKVLTTGDAALLEPGQSATL
jgi:purine-binding chemotaxis protein CheW